MRITSCFAAKAALVFVIAILVGRTTNGAPESPPGTWEGSLPNVTFKTQENKEVRLYEDLIKGKTVVINFMYTRCDGDLCTKGTENLKKVQDALGKRLGRDVFIYSITLDPKHDTPTVLKDYAKSQEAKWTFLTTDKPEDIEKVRHALGLFNRDAKKDADLKNHTGLIVIGNEAIGKKMAMPVLAGSQRIAEMIERVGPPKHPE